MAVSGIDHTIKIFSPDVRDQYNARKGIGVHAADSSGFSSLRWDRWRDRQNAGGAEGEAPDLADSEGEQPAPNGLHSRKRMDQAYQITSQNDMDLRGGRDDYFISVCAERRGGRVGSVLTGTIASCVCAAGAAHCERRGGRGWRGHGTDCDERG